jgi:hypothetical protein
MTASRLTHYAAISSVVDGAVRLDVLQIDAEGADGRILSSLPFDRLRPAIVHWEIKEMSKLEQEDALELLCSQGHLISRSGAEDMLAVRGE